MPSLSSCTTGAPVDAELCVRPFGCACVSVLAFACACVGDAGATEAEAVDPAMLVLGERVLRVRRRRCVGETGGGDMDEAFMAAAAGGAPINRLLAALGVLVRARRAG